MKSVNSSGNSSHKVSENMQGKNITFIPSELTQEELIDALTV